MALRDATRDDLDDPNYSFYSICWPHRDSMIGFVSRMNPVELSSPESGTSSTGTR